MNPTFKKIMGFIDKVSIGGLSLIALGSLLFFAIIYWALERYMQGPVSLPNGTEVSFGNCIYFSVVTFTSLGYGDIVPRGVSKILACSEVGLGLAFFGIFIARLSSAKQSYHLAQLYARDAQERLNDFASVLADHRDLCNGVLSAIRKGESPPRSLHGIQVDVYRTVLRIQAYVSFEVSANRDFLREMPIGAPARLLRRSAQLSQCVSALACFRESLHSQKQRRIAKWVITYLADVGDRVAKNSDDPSLSYEARRLAETCARETTRLDDITAKVDSKFRK